MLHGSISYSSYIAALIDIVPVCTMGIVLGMVCNLAFDSNGSLHLDGLSALFPMLHGSTSCISYITALLDIVLVCSLFTPASALALVSGLSGHCIGQGYAVFQC